MSVTSATTAGTTAATSSSGTTSSSSTGTDALSTLSGNFSNFLQMLMTQLKNQDPTSPLDTNQFTTELVQFSSVEQQINTNSSLTQLIQLTQTGEVLQSSSMLGKQVTVSADHVPLQNGTGQVNFTTGTAEPVTIKVSTDSGTTLRTVTANATKGDNSWTWDGKDNSGNAVADGSYKVSITTPSGSTTTAVPFSVTGTATGLSKSGTSLNLELGALSTEFSNVKTVGN